MTVRGYQLLADWSRQGTFDGVLEDLSSRVLAEPDISVSYGRDDSRATTVATAGKMTFALNNADQVFSPENGSSPIAGNVTPGTPVKLLYTRNGTISILFAGTLDEFEVDPQAAAKTFTGTVLDHGRSGGMKLFTPLYSGLRTGDAVNLILDLIGWPSTGRDIDPGATVMPWWWEEGTAEIDAIERLVQCEGPPAIAYVDRGVFTFRDRHHRILSAASLSSQATFAHAVPAGSRPASLKILKDTFDYDHGLRHIVNSVTFDVDQRQLAELEEVWSTESAITIGNGQSLILDVSSSDPFMDAVVPVAGVDYTADTTITVALSRTSGQSLQMTITASSGDVVITRLALRAKPLQVVRTVKVTREDAASISKHTHREWPGDTPPFVNVYDADAIAQRILATYATNRPVVTFQIADIDDAHITQILDRRVSDRITVVNDAMGLNADFTIERVTHLIRKLGIIHRVEFSCQVVDPVQPVNIFTFDIAGKGFNDGAFGVDGIDNPNNVFQFDVAGHGFNEGVFGT